MHNTLLEWNIVGLIGYVLFPHPRPVLVCPSVTFDNVLYIISLTSRLKMVWINASPHVALVPHYLTLGALTVVKLVGYLVSLTYCPLTINLDTELTVALAINSALENPAV